MQTCRKFSLVLSCVMLCASAAPQAAGPAAQIGNRSTMQQHYDAALGFQREGQLDRATDEYRAFLVDALGQLAADHAQIGDYSGAAPLFDEALRLAPGSDALERQYARAALLAGDYARAETLSRTLIQSAAGGIRDIAEAHQILGRALHKTNQLQDAKKELETAVALDASYANAYDLAVVCLDLDDEKCAAQLFAEMQNSFGDKPELHMNFGRAYGNSDFAPRAVTEFRKAIAEDPHLPGAHYSLAAALLLTSQDDAVVQQAIAELRQELVISPRDFLTYAALGKLAASQRHYDEAERYLRRAIALNPQSPDAFLYLGQMYFENGRTADAEAPLRQAIHLTVDPSRNRYQIQKAHYLLGRLLMQQHREKEARAEMDIARSFANKGLSTDKNSLAGLLQNNADPAESAPPADTSAAAANPTRSAAGSAAARDLAAFEKRIAPAIADTYNNLGVIAATGADYITALHNFEHAAAWNPGLDGLDLNLGRAAFMASQFAQAVAPLSRYVAAHPADSGTRGALAMSQFMTRNYSGCIETLKGVESDIASIPQMQYIYAESLVKIGQVDQGQHRLAVLVAAHPEIPDAHRDYGEALALEGQPQKAAAELRAALRLNSNDAESRYDLGKLELAAGDATAAIPDLQAATEIAPADPRYHRELAAAYEKSLRVAEAVKEKQLYEHLEAEQAKPANAEKSPQP